MASSIDNNGNFNVSSADIQLRANSGGVPLSHDDVDSNFENLRLGHNAVVTALAGKASSSHAHDLATAGNSGFMSSTMFSKLDGIDNNANNYSLEPATAGDLGGVKIGDNININSGKISVPLATSSTPGVVEYDNSTIKKNNSDQLYVDVSAVNTNTTYTADDVGIELSGTTFKHKDTSSQANISLGSRTYINGLTFDAFGHVTGVTSATETVTNTNTTYTAGTGITLSGTQFKHADTSSANSVNNSGNTVIQDITLDEFGHITGLTSTTISNTGSTFNSLTEVAGANWDGGYQIRIGGANTFNANQQGQLSVTSTSAAGIVVDSQATDSVAVMVLKGAQCTIQYQDDQPNTASDYGKIWNVGVNNNAFDWGVLSDLDGTQGSTLMRIHSKPVTDGSDGNGARYPHIGDYPVYGLLDLRAAIKLTNLDTSDVINDNLIGDGDTVMYNDMGSNLCIRGRFNSPDSSHRLFLSAHADEEANVPRNVSLHLATDKHETPTNTFGYRNTGRSIAYTGTSSDTNLELVSTNIKAYQTAIQTQRVNMRTSFTLQYEAADTTISNYGGGTQTGLSGTLPGFFAGVYLNAASNGQQRSLTPANYFDGAMNLGVATHRWATVFATTGSIDTSDVNAKQDIEDLSEAEKAVAVTLKGLIKKFRFKDAVAEKGDDARIHVGVIAQEVEQAFTSAGLDGFRYGLLCKDTVWKVMVDGAYTGINQAHGDKVDPGPNDEEIEGATLEQEVRYSVRYNELLAFIISAL